jgi:hypothetical protein
MANIFTSGFDRKTYFVLTGEVSLVGLLRDRITDLLFPFCVFFARIITGIRGGNGFAFSVFSACFVAFAEEMSLRFLCFLRVLFFCLFWDFCFCCVFRVCGVCCVFGGLFVMRILSPVGSKVFALFFLVFFGLDQKFSLWFFFFFFGLDQKFLFCLVLFAIKSA